MGLFVLLEAFDAADLDRAPAAAGAALAPRNLVLVGINCRDLSTLQVVPQRFAALAPLLPPAAVAVAESGVATAADAARDAPARLPRRADRHGADDA